MLPLKKSADHEDICREKAQLTMTRARCKKMRRVCKDRSLPLWRMAMFSRRTAAQVAEKTAEGGARRLFVADGAGKTRKLQQNEGKEPVKRAESRFRRNPTIRSSSTARRKQKIDGAPFGASSRRGRSIITASASLRTSVFGV